LPNRNTAGLLLTGQDATLCRTSANVNVCNDLPNGPHLKIDDEIELLDGDAPLAPNLTQTTFSAGEGNFAHFDWQLSYLHANALGHPPALICYRVGVFRHLVLPRLLTMTWSGGPIDGFRDA
jgi:hypothetical protein